MVFERIKGGIRVSGFLVLVILIGISAVWGAGSYLTKPALVDLADIPENATSVKFASSSGSEISGWVYFARKTSAIAVLLHGVRSNRMQMVSRAEHLQKMGISSLLIDFQAHGKSPGEMITLGHLESYDAQAAVAYMKSLFPDHPMIVIGVSMGGAAAVLAKPALDIDVLVIESVYPDIITAIANRLQARMPGGRFFTPLLALQIKPRAGIHPSALSPLKAAIRVKAATLVLSGNLDKHTTVGDTRKLYEALPAPKSLKFIEGAGHDDLEYFDPETYWSIVEPFVAKHIKYSQSYRSGLRVTG